MASATPKLEKSESTTGSTTKTTVKRTIIEETIEDTASMSSSVYRPTVAPRNLVIHRTAYSAQPQAATNRSVERSVSYGVQASPGGYALLTSSNVNVLKASRQDEKRDMQSLNTRFEDYINKVRYLEVQNKALADQLEKLKLKWGHDTAEVKRRFQSDLDQARHDLDAAVSEKARIEVGVASIEDEIEDLRQRCEDAQRAVMDAREKIERQQQQVADYKNQIQLLKRRCETVDGEREKDRTAIANLQGELQTVRSNLDRETLTHINAENRKQTLEEELAFLRALYEQEIKELSALAYYDSSSENRQYWKNEMSQALADIGQVYEDKLDGMRAEMQTYYNVKVKEFSTSAVRGGVDVQLTKEETGRLRTDITDYRAKLADLDAKNATLGRELEAMRREKDAKEREMESDNNELKAQIVIRRSEMERILRELRFMMDAKLGLELEIAAYRKLLEGEEHRGGLRDLMHDLEGKSMGAETKVIHDTSYTIRQTEQTSGDSSNKVSQVVKGEMSAKTSYTRSAKGPITISDIDTNGKFLTLENNGHKDENLGEWKLKRKIDGVDKIDFALPKDFIVKPSTKPKIWAKGAKPADAAAIDIELDQTSWGMGANIQTRLVNPAGEDRATHTQSTSYTS